MFNKKYKLEEEYVLVGISFRINQSSYPSKALQFLPFNIEIVLTVWILGNWEDPLGLQPHHHPWWRKKKTKIRDGGVVVPLSEEWQLGILSMLPSILVWLKTWPRLSSPVSYIIYNTYLYLSLLAIQYADTFESGCSCVGVTWLGQKELDFEITPWQLCSCNHGVAMWAMAVPWRTNRQSHTWNTWIISLNRMPWNTRNFFHMHNTTQHKTRNNSVGSVEGKSWNKNDKEKWQNGKLSAACSQLSTIFLLPAFCPRFHYCRQINCTPSQTKAAFYPYTWKKTIHNCNYK